MQSGRPNFSRHRWTQSSRWACSRSAFVLGLLGLFVYSLPLRAADGVPPLPEIPGITTEDHFPNACVDCHVNMPEAGMDFRLSTTIRRWNDAVDPPVLARILDLVPNSADLLGKHPVLPDESFENIPGACMTCHNGALPKAPPFAPMLHAIHLNGGEQNHFIMMFNGSCTNCHKFDKASAKWAIPSGAEH